MRRPLIVACGLVVFTIAVPALASFFDFEQITVDNTSGGVTFSSAKITPTTGAPPMTFARCRARTAEMSFLTVDPAKTPVTASVGQLIEPGDWIYIFGREEMLNFRAIRTTATSGQLDCLYKDQP